MEERLALVVPDYVGKVSSVLFWCDHLSPFAWPTEIVGSLLLSLLPRDTWCLDHVLISLLLLCSPMVDVLHCDKALQRRFAHKVCSRRSALVVSEYGRCIICSHLGGQLVG
jgi:hypothetical protein